MTGDPDLYPEWRPLAYLTIWLQYQWAGLDHVGSYYVVNLLIWTAVAWLVFLLVYRLADSWFGGLLAGWVVAADPRPVFAVLWIDDRMNSLACLFGLLALLIVVPRTKPMTPARWIATAVFLLAAALSKEFGLAFAAAVTVMCARDRRYAFTAAGIAAAGVYIALRMIFAGGAPGPLCDQMGYFFEQRAFCFSGVDLPTVSQAVYNMMAAGIGAVAPGLLASTGQIQIAPTLVALGLPLLVLALLGWKQEGPTRTVTLLLIGFCAIINMSSYRERNLVIALCGFAVAAGAGMATGDRLLRARGAPAVVRAVAVCLLAGVMMAETVRTRAVVGSIVESVLKQDPCEGLMEYRGLEPSFVARIKTKYGMTDPDCRLLPRP